MKLFLFAISLIIVNVALPPAGRAAEISRGQAPATNAVLVTTEFIDRLMEEARTNSPALRAVNSRAKAAEFNAGAVRTWEDPVALFGGSVYSDRAFDPAEEGNLTYGIEQKLPLWGRQKLSRHVAEAEVSMRQAEAEYRFQQLRRDIIKALLTTAFAQRIVEVGEQDLAWLQSTAKTVENKYRAGQAVVADTLQIQNEVARHADALRTQRRQFGHERLTLNRLLNRDVESAWPSLQLPPVAPAISFSEKLLSLALQNEPRLKVLEQEIKQAEASAALTRNSRLPDVSLGIEGRQYSGDGGFRSGMFVLRTSLPWVNRDRYRREYEREKEKQHSAEQERAEQVLMLKEQLHHLVVGIEATRREALLHRDEITTRATQALSSRLADWESGRGAFRDVLDARRTLLESQLLSARAISDQNQMMAELLLWTGLENFEALARLASEPPLLPEPDNPN